MPLQKMKNHLPVVAMDQQIGMNTIHAILEENKLLRGEIRVAREAAKITADLVVKQFEETEKILNRFQVANAQRKAVLDSASQIAIIATDITGIVTVFNTGAENILGYDSRDIGPKALTFRSVLTAY